MVTTKDNGVKCWRLWHMAAQTESSCPFVWSQVDEFVVAVKNNQLKFGFVTLGVIKWARYDLLPEGKWNSAKSMGTGGTRSMHFTTTFKHKALHMKTWWRQYQPINLSH